jgi:hypothetical protein
MYHYLKITYFGTVAKLNNRTDLELVTDSQDVNAIKEYLAGQDKRNKQYKKLKDYSLFLVKVENGDYAEIYASTKSVPWLGAHLDKIVPITRNQ